MKIATLLVLGSFCGNALAESVDVKYHGRISLDDFECTVVNERSDVSRICYDASQRYMVIQLKTTYYHYCEIDEGTVRGLKGADSKRQYFEAKIRGTGKDGPFDCRTHPIPKKYR